MSRRWSGIQVHLRTQPPAHAVCVAESVLCGVRGLVRAPVLDGDLDGSQNLVGLRAQALGPGLRGLITEANHSPEPWALRPEACINSWNTPLTTTMCL